MEAEAESRNGKRKRETETEKTETGTTRTTTRTTTCKWSRGPLARTTRSLGRGSPLRGAAPRSGRHSYAIGNRGWRPEHQNHLQITPKPLARPLANLIDHSPDHLHDHLQTPLWRHVSRKTPLANTTCTDHSQKRLGPRSNPKPLARPLAPTIRIPWNSHSQTTRMIFQNHSHDTPNHSHAPLARTHEPKP